MYLFFLEIFYFRNYGFIGFVLWWGVGLFFKFLYLVGFLEFYLFFILLSLDLKGVGYFFIELC